MSRKDVSEKIRRLMEEEGKEMRVRVKGMRRKLESAISSNGSSMKNFDRFVEDLRKQKVGK